MCRSNYGMTIDKLGLYQVKQIETFASQHVNLFTHCMDCVPELLSLQNEILPDCNLRFPRGASRIRENSRLLN